MFLEMMISALTSGTPFIHSLTEKQKYTGAPLCARHKAKPGDFLIRKSKSLLLRHLQSNRGNRLRGTIAMIH